MLKSGEKRMTKCCNIATDVCKKQCVVNQQDNYLQRVGLYIFE